MNECRKIEPLIYLYRDDELSVGERTKVLEHTKTCSRCHEILQQLHSIDAGLVPLRESVPDLSGDAALVSRTMDRIAGTGVRVVAAGKRALLLDELFGWLRPTLSFIVLAAAALFVVQQSRDAVKIAELESRLRTHGDAAASANPYTDSEALRLITAASSERGRETPLPSSLRGAAIGVDPMQFIGSGLLGLFQRNKGLFEELSRRYPNLSKITIEDGIDERERKILATEGKAFMKEFEQLLREGER